MSRSEPAATRPTQAPYRRARNPKPIVIVSAYSKTDAIRRAGMSFIQRPKTAWVSQVQLAGQRRMEVDPVPAVGPVVEQRVGLEQRAGRRPTSGPGRAAPTTAPTSAGCSGRPARPRSGRCRRSSAPGPRGRPQTPGGWAVASGSRGSDPPTRRPSGRDRALSGAPPEPRFVPSDSSVVRIDPGPFGRTGHRPGVHDKPSLPCKNTRRRHENRESGVPTLWTEIRKADKDH